VPRGNTALGSLQNASEESPQQPARVVAVAPVQTEAAPVSMKSRARSGEAAERYQYVVAEVKRIGILGGSIFLVIVILSLILG